MVYESDLDDDLDMDSDGEMMVLSREFMQRRNRRLVKALAAACAYLATAHDADDQAFIQQAVESFQANDRLRIFSKDLIIRYFHRMVRKFAHDFNATQEQALLAITKIRPEKHESRLLTRICFAMIASHGGLNDRNRPVLADICMACGVRPREYGL